MKVAYPRRDRPQCLGLGTGWVNWRLWGGGLCEKLSEFHVQKCNLKYASPGRVLKRSRSGYAHDLHFR